MQLLLDLFLKVGQLVLKGHDHLFCNLLLLFELLATRDLLLSPLFIFLAHRIDIISYEVDTLSQRISALTKHLNSLLHELGVLLGETLP